MKILSKAKSLITILDDEDNVGTYKRLKKGQWAILIDGMEYLAYDSADLEKCFKGLKNKKK